MTPQIKHTRTELGACLCPLSNSRTSSAKFNLQMTYTRKFSTSQFQTPKMRLKRTGKTELGRFWSWWRTSFCLKSIWVPGLVTLNSSWNTMTSNSCLNTTFQKIRQLIFWPNTLLRNFFKSFTICAIPLFKRFCSSISLEAWISNHWTSKWKTLCWIWLVLLGKFKRSIKL